MVKRIPSETDVQSYVPFPMPDPMFDVAADNPESVEKTVTVVPLEELIKSMRTVPVAPEILPKLQVELQDPDTDISDLAALIRLDAGLATAVLKVSNSAYYNRGSRIGSIEDSVGMIGYEETLRVVARCSFSTVMRCALTAYGISGEVFWESAVMTAFAMQVFARVVDMDQSDAYLAGLLHPMGMAVINDHMQRTESGQCPVPSNDRAGIAEWEKKTFGYHQGDVGAALARQWRFPDCVAEALEAQFDERVKTGASAVACVLPLAITVAYFVQNPADYGLSERGEHEPEFDLARAKQVGLDLRQLLNTTAEVKAAWAKTREFLL